MIKLKTITKKEEILSINYKFCPLCGASLVVKPKYRICFSCKKIFKLYSSVWKYFSYEIINATKIIKLKKVKNYGGKNV